MIKDHIKIYMLFQEASNFNSLQIMGFLETINNHKRYIHINNVIFIKTVTKLFPTLKKCLLPYLNLQATLKIKVCFKDCIPHGIICLFEMLSMSL